MFEPTIWNWLIVIPSPPSCEKLIMAAMPTARFIVPAQLREIHAVTAGRSPGLQDSDTSGDSENVAGYPGCLA